MIYVPIHHIKESISDLPASVRHLDEAEKVDYLVRNFTVMQVQKNQPLPENTELYQKVKIQGNPLQMYDENKEVLMFPELYPLAGDGPSTHRQIALTHFKYFFHRMNSAMGRQFQENQQYIMYLHNEFCRRLIDRAIYRIINSGRLHGGITAEQILHHINAGTMPDNLLATKFTEIPLTKEYWAQRKSN